MRRFPRSLYPTHFLTLAALVVAALTTTTLIAAPAHAQHVQAQLGAQLTGDGTQYEVIVEIVPVGFAPGEAPDVGAFTYVVGYNTAALDFHSGTYSAFVTGNDCYAETGPDDDATRGQVEMQMFPDFLGDPANCEPDADDDAPGEYGTPLPDAGTIVAILLFDVVDPLQPSGLAWRDATTTDDDGDVTGRLADARGCDAATGCFTDLPVTLAGFEAIADGNAVLLRWQTASETNNAGFSVEARRTGIDADAAPWSPLAFVDGHGTTAEPQRYAHRAEGLAPGRYRFRLKQIDFDGAFAYGPEVEVELALPGGFALSDAYPNPFNPQTTFTLAVAQAQRVRVEVYDVLGRRLRVLLDAALPAGEATRLVFDATGLPSGVYLLRTAGETFHASRRVTLVR